MYIFVTPNIQSHRKGYLQSNKYFPEFEKTFIHLSICFSKSHDMDFCLSYLIDKILKGHTVN